MAGLESMIVDEKPSPVDREKVRFFLLIFIMCGVKNNKKK